MARRRRRMRNPVGAAAGALKDWTQGVDITDAAAAVGGFAAASMLPGLLIKPATTGGELTTTQKWLKVGLALGSAIGAGLAAKSFMSAAAGKAAVIGGIAGAGTQLINLIRPGTITRALPGPNFARSFPMRVGSAETVSPAFTREGETVQVIQP